MTTPAASKPAAKAKTKHTEKNGEAVFKAATDYDHPAVIEQAKAK